MVRYGAVGQGMVRSGVVWSGTAEDSPAVLFWWSPYNKVIFNFKIFS